MFASTTRLRARREGSSDASFNGLVPTNVPQTTVKAQFPLLRREIDGAPIHYLDSANTSQKPQQVIDAMADHYAHHNANIARAMHQLGAESTAAYEAARDKVAAFIAAPSRDEIVFANNNEYCGKFLKFKAGAKFSMHFHVEKRETFYVSEGVVELHWFDLTNATPCSKRLGVGQIVDIPRNCPHQIIALENATIIEVSTHHKDSDSYRIAPGDSQKQTA